MKTLGIIIARAGSKGLPGKNLRQLGGKPLVAWTIEHALAATRLNRVVLSTDSSAIAELGRRYGLDVVLRPPQLATDTATVDSAVRHALDQVQSRTAETYDAVVILYGNVPLRPAGLIDRAIEKLADSGADSVQSVCPVGKTHPNWMKKLAGPSGDVLQPYEPNTVYRRQDLPPVYQLDGGLIAVTRRSLQRVVPSQPHAFLGENQRAVVTEPGQVVDIDAAVDLAFAQAMLAGAPHLAGAPESAPTGRSAHFNTPHRDVVKIGPKTAGAGRPVYIVAELGVNHDGSLQRAIELTHAAHDAGADAIKLQLFDPRLLLSNSALLAEYQKNTADDPYRMLAALQLPVDSMLKIREHAHRLGLGFIVTCFSPALVEPMHRLDVDAVKVASPDAVNLPLLEALLTLDKPLLISTGACDLNELQPAVALCAGRPLVLMQCVSAYPVEPGQAALGGIDALRSYRVPVGYSDHATDPHIGMLAAARGACVIEKHLTHHRSAPGPDHAASFDPPQFKHYVALIRQAQRELGPPTKRVLPCEHDVRRVSRQSLCAVCDLPAGHVIRREDLTVKRPGTGIPAAKLSETLGRTLARPVHANHLLHEDDLRG
jgi:sialic acid synthase SpsE/CMP-N-acetylneuraminic acid synthetase